MPDEKADDEFVLSVRGLKKSYGSLEVLRGVDLAVRRGEVLGLLGPNGAGKTSLIRMTLDLGRPDGGDISVLGRTASTAVKRRIGYLPEERGLYPKQRVGTVLTYLVSLHGLPRPEARRRAEAWLHRVDLSDFIDAKVHTLSKGMQQKVQLGAAILHRPDLVILDEPFTGLDPVGRRLVRTVVRELVDEGTGVLVSTHLMDQVEQLADSVILLRQGQALISGPVSQVRRRFAGRTVELATDNDWQALDGIAELIERVDPNPDFDRVTLADGVEGDALLRRLVQAGARVRHFSQALPSLEEIFVRAVGGPADEVLAELAHGSPTP